jgi:hypothetical protein
METGGGMLGRVSEKLLTGVGFALLVLLGVTVYRMEPATRQAIWGGIWRTVAWLVFAGALPWTARFFVRRLLEVGSNWAGVAAIAGFVLMDAVVGLYLMRGLPGSGGAWLAALAALGVAGTYNYLVTEYLAEQAGG